MIIEIKEEEIKSETIEETTPSKAFGLFVNSVLKDCKLVFKAEI